MQRLHSPAELMQTLFLHSIVMRAQAAATESVLAQLLPPTHRQGSVPEPYAGN